MSTRTFVIILVVILVIGGLIAGCFMQTIERALTARPTLRVVHKIPSVGATMPAITPVPSMPVQQPTNLLAQDTFQRQNQRLWGTASDGRIWNGDASTAGNIFTVNANMGQIANGQGTFNALLGPSSTNSEALLAGSVSDFAGGTNLGVVLRWSDDNNWYKLLLDGTHVSILKRVHGESVTLRSVPFKAQTAMIYMLRFRVVGVMLFARVWRSDAAEPKNWQMTVSDTALALGQDGVRVLTQKNTVMNITAFTAATASSIM